MATSKKNSKKSSENSATKGMGVKQKTVRKLATTQPRVAAKPPVKPFAVKPQVSTTAVAIPAKKPRAKKAVPSKKISAEQKKPGLVSMAPATKARATRKSTIITASPSRRSNDKSEKNLKSDKVAVVQQEQIMADDLQAKVVNTPAADAPLTGRTKVSKQTATSPRTAEAPKVKAAEVSLPTARARRHRRLRRVAVLMVFLIVALAGSFAYINHHRQVAASADAKIIQAVSARAVLPANESPSISTVVDSSKVSQAFLAGAKNGDKVLLYFQAGKAIVYRPSTGQIVNMGPLQEPQPRVMIRKGAANADVSKIGAEIAASNTFTVASRDESPSMNYAKTIVVDVAGNRPDVAGNLAQLLHATVASLPQGETRPDADLLVIVGSDSQQVH